MPTDETASKTLEDDSEGAIAVAPVRPHLFLVLEADRPWAGAARHALSGVEEVVLGRGRERSARRDRAGGRSRLVLEVPGRSMSAVHARIVLTRGRWVLEDAGSRNGTYVSGERVGRRTLVDGDVFEAGHSLFVFRDALPTPPSVAADVASESLLTLPSGLRTLLPTLQPGLDALVRVAKTDVPLVLLGSTGTGKEVLARAAHDLSGRSGPFVAVNCGGLSPALVEGLLYGHVKGSFSGAGRDEPGFVRAADGGTLFLDEVGDFPPAAQPSLLRVLQEREVVPVGSSRPIRVDFRLVAATHRDLDVLVAAGTFRQDLLMRIDGFRHPIPSLRDRREDLGVLLAEILPRRAGARASEVTFTGAAARALLEYAWPGNVRELEQAIGRALALAREGVIDAGDLGLPLAAKGSGAPPALADTDAKLRDEVIAALTAHEGNVTDVARAMGKARMQIQRWIARFGIDPEAYRRSK